MFDVLGAPRTALNWQEAIIEMFLVVSVGLFTVAKLIRDVTKRRRAEEEREQLRTVDLITVSFPFPSRANRREPKGFAEHAEPSRMLCVLCAFSATSAVKLGMGGGAVNRNVI